MTGLALILWAACGEPPAPPPVVGDFVLLDDQGKARELYRLADRPAVVLIAHEPGCTESDYPAIAALADDLADDRVPVWLLASAEHDARPGIAAAAADLDVPILLDDSRTIAAGLGLTTSPEALVLDPETWQIVWQGGLGTDGVSAAVAAWLDGTPLPPPMPATGRCPLTLPDPVDFVFDEHVAPILQERCRVCHQPKGVAPFAMDSYGQVLGWAPMIREVLRTRRMPPWNADPSVGEFRHDLALTGDERRAIIGWVERGSPPGTGPDPLAASGPPDTRPADAQDEARDAVRPDPDYTFVVDEQQIPATGLLPYRYFDLGTVDEDVWVSGMRIKPRNTKVVHHACVIVSPQGLDDYGSLGKLRSAVHSDDRVERTHFWTPGRRFRRNWPDGYAFWLPAGSHLILEIHYNPSGKPETDQPRVDLYADDGEETPTRIRVMYVQNRDFVLPAGAPDFDVKATEVLDQDIVVTGLNVHMHYRGRGARLDATVPGEDTRTLLSVPHYDFNWQRGYPPLAPIPLPAGTVLESIGTFDNSAMNPLNPEPTRWVPWGTQTPINEMFKASITYHLADEAPAE